MLAVGLAFLTSSATLAFSTSVRADGFTTGVIAGVLTPFESASFTVFSGVKTATEPSGKVTVAVPSLPTSTLLAVGLAFLTSSATLAFSASVRADGFTTGVIAGSLVATFGVLSSDVLPSLLALAVTGPAGISTVGVMLALPSSPVTPSPILLPSLSNSSTLVPGSAVTSTGVLVPALPVRSVVTTGLLGLAEVSGVAAVA